MDTADTPPPTPPPSVPPKYDYLAAIGTLLHGGKALWIGSLATVALGIEAVNVAASISKKQHEVIETKLDDGIARVGHTSDAATGDSCGYAKELATTKKALAAALAAQKHPHTSASSSTNTKHRVVYFESVRSPSRRVSPRAASVVKKPQDTAAEQRQLTGEWEGQHWLQLINYSNLKSHKNLVGKSVIEGVITSAATTATYKDLVLHIRFDSRTTGETLPDRTKVITQFLSPGKSLKFKMKLKAPIHADSISYKITGVDYLLAP